MGNGLILIIYFLMAYGTTNLLVNGRGPFNLLGGMRRSAKYISKELGKMLECMMCTSTNVGLILSVIDLLLTGIAFTPFNLLLPDAYWWLIVPFDMFITSGVVWLIDAVELWFEEKQLYVGVSKDEDENNTKTLLND